MDTPLQRAVSAWGYEGAGLDGEEIAALGRLLQAQFPDAALEQRAPRPLAEVELPPRRLAPPAALAGICHTDRRTRCLHALGRSFADVVHAFRGEFAAPGRRPPDVVATPRDADEVAAVLDWCAEAGAAAVPFGGGTSVVGGVTPPAEDRPVVTVQLRAMDRVLEVESASRAAHVQAGATGPVLEEQLRAHGLTLRFFPQSFELSTLGGWVATRAAGHFATGATHIDDLVESVSAETPAGRWASRRLPGSGAGPSPDRLLLGSEGILGVVTAAWVRLQARPRWRAGALVYFESFLAGARAVQALAQSGLAPANCRLLDPLEAALAGSGDGREAVLVLGLESADHPVTHDASRALEICADLGGRCPEGLTVREESPATGTGGDTAGEADGAAPGERWRAAFLRAPYQRDALVALGAVCETFETAVTWDRFAALHSEVVAAVERAVGEVCGGGLVTARITHAYPDGAAPYYTVIAPGRHGEQVARWQAVKQAASEAVLAAGGTITHHHAVGRDHRPWYDRQRPEPFARSLRAAKDALDPAGLLNPGVLVG